MMRRRPILALLLTATACVPAAPPPPPAPPAPVPVAPPAPAPLASDWRDWPLTPGTWRYSREANGSRSVFGEAAGSARLVLRCDAGTRQLQLMRSGTAVTPITVRTSSTTRALPVASLAAIPPQVGATVAATDPLLDAIAFSRGRFIVEQAGSAPLVIPTYAEIGRVIEDCRG